MWRRTASPLAPGPGRAHSHHRTHTTGALAASASDRLAQRKTRSLLLGRAENRCSGRRAGVEGDASGADGPRSGQRAEERVWEFKTEAKSPRLLSGRNVIP
jgi:hypothetical protein